MKIRERLIRCGDFSIEREHLTIDTIYALKCYLILRKAGMNILGGRILFYFLADGTDPETMRKLKELERKNRDRLCLACQYETYPAGLGIFMQGDLMYEVMSTGLSIRDAQELSPIEAVKILEKHLHFTLEAEEMDDIDKILAVTGSTGEQRKKKKENPSACREDDAHRASAPPEKERGEACGRDTEESQTKPQTEKATVPERFIRKHTAKAGEGGTGRKEVPERGRELPELESGKWEGEDCSGNYSGPMEYMEYDMGLMEEQEEKEYMDALCGEEELLRQNGIIDDGPEGEQDQEDVFVLDIGDE